MSLKECNWTDIIKIASPYPYALAVTIAPDNRPNIMGLSWWSIVSWQPPMLMISLGFPRYSFQCLENLPEFTLCIPSSDQSKGAWLCGTKSGKEHDKFSETGFMQIKSKIVKPPMIDGCTAVFECKVVKNTDAGDHRIFIAEIVATHCDTKKSGHIYTVGYGKMIGLGSDLMVERDLPE